MPPRPPPVGLKPVEATTFPNLTVEGSTKQDFNKPSNVMSIRTQRGLKMERQKSLGYPKEEEPEPIKPVERTSHSSSVRDHVR